MHYTDLPPHWSSTLEKLALHQGHAQPPTGASIPWYTAIMRFGTRGFFMTFMNKKEERVALRIELNHPMEELASSFARELEARLETLGLTNLTIEHNAPAPAFIEGTSSPSLDDSAEAIESLMLLLMKVGDHIIALDDDPRSPSPLQEVNATFSTAPAPNGFEPIGQEPDAAPPRDTPAPATTSSSPFESIGSSTPTPSAKEITSGELQITDHDVRLRTDHVLLELQVAPTPVHHTFIAGLEHMLRTRFDAEVSTTEAPASDDSSWRLHLRPGLTTASDRERELLRDDISRYIKKVRDFQAMGVSLGEVLGISEERPSTGASGIPASERSTRKDIPSRRQETPTHNAGEDDSTGFVLGLGGSAGAPKSPASAPRAHQREPEHTLTPGDFTDERLRREDATGPLVDLVLRHPGYSDRNMSKVLTLLLSVEYSQAQAIIEKAPCVLSWGIGRERAQTMKSVIEGAGGKVVMVEPDTFAAS